SRAKVASRRAFLTRIGRLVLAATGATLLAALPVDRRVAAVDACCGDDWRWCNLSGLPCARCGGTNTSCPGSGCVTTGTPWTGCCLRPGAACANVIQYRDCCKDPNISGCGTVSCS